MSKPKERLECGDVINESGDVYACEQDECQTCCEHEYDIDEGYMCLKCGHQGDIGELIDAAEYIMGDR